ncbi:hypothetical protein L596_013245 [Steinernema carpocapsae]|uniref:Uncharacterized protein n=1 Tax=Steinernema carpocapsae TaxID=34508 RepID=A0A4U5NZR3_STECR|nr:hypothetical protein L596_013245 [Steinernema carpocapsae]
MDSTPFRFVEDVLNNISLIAIANLAIAFGQLPKTRKVSKWNSLADKQLNTVVFYTLHIFIDGPTMRGCVTLGYFLAPHNAISISEFAALNPKQAKIGGVNVCSSSSSNFSQTFNTVSPSELAHLLKHWLVNLDNRLHLHFRNAELQKAEILYKSLLSYPVYFHCLKLSYCGLESEQFLERQVNFGHRITTLILTDIWPQSIQSTIVKFFQNPSFVRLWADSTTLDFSLCLRVFETWMTSRKPKEISVFSRLANLPTAFPKYLVHERINSGHQFILKHDFYQFSEITWRLSLIKEDVPSVSGSVYKTTVFLCKLD